MIIKDLNKNYRVLKTTDMLIEHCIHKMPEIVFNNVTLYSNRSYCNSEKLEIIFVVRFNKIFVNFSDILMEWLLPNRFKKMGLRHYLVFSCFDEKFGEIVLEIDPKQKDKFVKYLDRVTRFSDRRQIYIL